VRVEVLVTERTMVVHLSEERERPDPERGADPHGDSMSPLEPAKRVARQEAPERRPATPTLEAIRAGPPGEPAPARSDEHSKDNDNEELP
jgi:hypothetical protein